MSVSNELISEFVKVTNDKDEKKNEATQPGTIVKSGDLFYVRLDGSECLTPVNSTVEIEHGDRVNVLIKNHDATVVGNLTKKATGIEKVTQLLADGSLDINVNNLTINAGGSATIDAKADFIVKSGGTVNLNDRLILDEEGTLSLKVDSFSIGDSEDIDNLDDLKGEPGTPGKDGEDGRDGIDVSSQYLVFKSYDSQYDSAGLNVTYKPNNLSEYHTNVNASGFRIMNGSTSLLKINAYNNMGARFECAAGSSFWMDNSSLSISDGDGDLYCSSIFCDEVIGDLVESFGTVTGDTLNTKNPAISTSSKANCRIATSNKNGIHVGDIIYTDGGGSLRKWKHDIEDLHSDDIDANKLYDIPVRQFIYNDGYLNYDSPRRGKILPGFIAEEVEEIYPCAAAYDEAGDLENWDERMFIPPMLKLIQDQKEQLDTQLDLIESLEMQVQELRDTIESLTSSQGV